jgi:hypothetical protein
MHFELCPRKTCLCRSCKHASNVARVVETHTGTPCLNPPQSHSPCPFCRAVWHHRLTRKPGLPPFERSTSEMLLTTGCSKIASLSCSICCSISGLVPLICSQVVPVCNSVEVRINICTRGCTVKAGLPPCSVQGPAVPPTRREAHPPLSACSLSLLMIIGFS